MPSAPTPDAARMDSANTDAPVPDATMNEPAPPPGPAIILVQPQLAENIGMTARAMANFGLSDLRLVAPKNGWPKKGVREAASGATHVLDGARVYDTLAEAIADLHFVLATTARERGQMKRVLAPEEAMRDVAARAGQRTGILFGRERAGLDNDEVSLADAIVTFPVDARFSSLNLAQGVLLMGYEWRRAAGLAHLPFTGEMLSPRPRGRRCCRCSRPSKTAWRPPASIRRRSGTSSPATCATCSTAWP